MDVVVVVVVLIMILLPAVAAAAANTNIAVNFVCTQEFLPPFLLNIQMWEGTNRRIMLEKNTDKKTAGKISTFNQKWNLLNFSEDYINCSLTEYKIKISQVTNNLVDTKIRLDLFK